MCPGQAFGNIFYPVRKITIHVTRLLDHIIITRPILRKEIIKTQSTKRIKTFFPKKPLSDSPAHATIAIHKGMDRQKLVLKNSATDHRMQGFLLRPSKKGLHPSRNPYRRRRGKNNFVVLPPHIFGSATGLPPPFCFEKNPLLPAGDGGGVFKKKTDRASIAV